MINMIPCMPFIAGALIGGVAAFGIWIYKDKNYVGIFFEPVTYAFLVLVVVFFAVILDAIGMFKAADTVEPVTYKESVVDMGATTLDGIAVVTDTGREVTVPLRTGAMRFSTELEEPQLTVIEHGHDDTLCWTEYKLEVPTA